MSDLLLPILIAFVVALLVIGAAQALRALLDGEKRKLQQRLSTENRLDGSIPLARAVRAATEHGRLTAALLRIAFFNGLYRKVVQAWPTMSLAKFLAISVALSLTLGVMAFAFAGSAVVALTGLVLGAYLPMLVLSNRRSARQRTLALQLPEALDFLSRILKAGHSLSTGLQMMGDELPKPLGEEFRRAYDQHSLGLTMDEAMKDMTTRIESSDFAFFVTAVLIQRQTGGDLSEVLSNISGMIRQRIRLQQHVKAKTAEGRFTGYILSAFPVVMFLLASMLNPSYTSVLWKTSEGLVLLGVAFTLTVVGLFAIKKITTLKV
jgi:tight adherence protein B